jgi:hypothetical protein
VPLLLSRVKLVISAGIPVPDTDKVKLVTFTAEAVLVSVNTICWTVTPEDPATWVELAGGLEPWAAETVTAVGVPLGVLDAVNEAVDV